MDEQVLENSSFLSAGCNSAGSNTECENFKYSLKAYTTSLQYKSSLKVFQENTFKRIRENSLHNFGHTGKVKNISFKKKVI